VLDDGEKGADSNDNILSIPVSQAASLMLYGFARIGVASSGSAAPDTVGSTEIHGGFSMTCLSHSPLKVGHIVFGRGDLNGRDVMVAGLARAQNETIASAAVVLAAGTAFYHASLRRLGAEVLEFPDGHRLGAWLRTAARFARRDPREGSFTVLHGHGCRAVFLVTLLRLLRRPGWTSLPFVYTNHGFFEDSLLHRISLWWELFCLRWVDHYVVCSASQVARLRERGIWRHADVIANGVSLPPAGNSEEQRARAKQRLGLAADTPLVGMVGRLSSEKRPDIFLRACEIIATRHPDAHFLISGDGPLRERVQGWVADQSLAGQVHLVGHVEPIEHIYRALDVLMLTSDFEGSPLVVLEAMAAGLPVVATAVGGVPEVIDDGHDGLLASRRDPVHLAEAVGMLLESTELRSTIGQSARKRVVEQFTVEQMRDQLARVYENLAHPRTLHLTASGRRSGAAAVHDPEPVPARERG